MGKAFVKGDSKDLVIEQNEDAENDHRQNDTGPHIGSREGQHGGRAKQMLGYIGGRRKKMQQQIAGSHGTYREHGDGGVPLDAQAFSATEEDDSAQDGDGKNQPHPIGDPYHRGHSGRAKGHMGKTVTHEGKTLEYQHNTKD